MRRPIAFLLLFGLLAAAPAAEARSYKIDVPRTLAKRIAKTRAETDAAILLPSRYTAERKRLYGSGGAIEGGGYSFGLSSVKGCGGAGACTVANFYALDEKRPFFKKTVKLARGVTGYYKGSSCGANCSDPEVQWLDDGLLYGMSATVGPQRGEKRRLVRLANSAIKNGPR